MRWIAVAVGVITTSVSGCSDRTEVVGDGVPVLSVAEEASLVLGDERSPLFQVVGASFVGDTLLVAEASTNSVRLFGPAGNLIDSVGGRGEGPGEFSRVGWMQVADGGLFVWDFGARRLSRFSLRGELQADHLLPELPDGRRTNAGGVFDDGSVLLAAVTPAPNLPEFGLRRTLTALFKWSPESGQVDSIGTMWSDEGVRLPPNGFSMTIPFGAKVVWAIRGNRVLVADGADTVISVFPSADVVASQIAPSRPPGHRVEFTAQDVELIRTTWVDSASERARPRREQAWELLELPPPAPRFGPGLHVDPVGGNVWVLNSSGPRDPTPVWTVVDSTGMTLSHVLLPDGSELLAVSGDRVALLLTDQLDVERLEVRTVSPDE